MKLQKSYDFFQQAINNLAESLTKNNYRITKWGIHWERSRSRDLIFILNSRYFASSYLDDQKGHPIVLKSQSSNSSSVLKYWYRKYQQVSPPFPDGLEFDSFSFDDRRSSSSFFDLLDNLSLYSKIEDPFGNIFNNDARAILHIGKNARLWLMKDNDDNPISVAISSELEAYEGILGIFLLGTHPNLRNRGNAKTLLEYILATQRKNLDTALFSIFNSPSDNVCKQLGFELEDSFELL